MMVEATRRRRTPRLLAVEDEPGNAALLEAILRRAGYQLSIATGVEEARAFLALETPALVLLDRQLPDGDGLELIPEIRASARTADIPILVVSGSLLPRDVRHAMDAGADGFLAKPVRVKPLLEEVERLLDAGAVAPKLAD